MNYSVETSSSGWFYCINSHVSSHFHVNSCIGSMFNESSLCTPLISCCLPLYSMTVSTRKRTFCHVSIVWILLLGSVKGVVLGFGRSMSVFLAVPTDNLKVFAITSHFFNRSLYCDFLPFALPCCILMYRTLAVLVSTHKRDRPFKVWEFKEWGFITQKYYWGS